MNEKKAALSRWLALRRPTRQLNLLLLHFSATALNRAIATFGHDHL